MEVSPFSLPSSHPLPLTFIPSSRLEYRPLEGFIYAITPFNFTAIAGNLPCAPALLGNVVIWKPSPAALASNYLLYRILLEAGLPPAVIQFLPTNDAAAMTSMLLSHPQLAALHYTGSTSVFRSLHSRIASNVAAGAYATYPRVVGETGGKNFHLVTRDAAVGHAAVNTVRGAFEYAGQKCSATSRCYVSELAWPAFRERLVAETEALRQGPPEGMENFIGPVIHAASFDKLRQVIDEARDDPELELLAGGTYDNGTGYFIRPTIYSTANPSHPLLSRELFGPILVCHPYSDPPSSPSPYTTTTVDTALQRIAHTIDTTTPYALTGAIFSRSRATLAAASHLLRNAAGNLYLNCKSTGAVVAQQPFGGARASGTNDKAGSAALLSRFVSVRCVKEQFQEDERVAYPSND